MSVAVHVLVIVPKPKISSDSTSEKDIIGEGSISSIADAVPVFEGVVSAGASRIISEGRNKVGGSTSCCIDFKMYAPPRLEVDKGIS